MFDKTWNFVTIIPLVLGYGGLEDLSIISISISIFHYFKVHNCTFTSLKEEFFTMDFVRLVGRV